MNLGRPIPKGWTVDESDSEENRQAILSLKEYEKEILPLCKKSSKFTWMLFGGVKKSVMVVIDNTLGKPVALFMEGRRILCIK